MQKYISQQWSIFPFAVAFSLAFVSHLSAGWLLPGVCCVPLLSSHSKKIRDLFLLILIFTIFQCLFWGGLIVWKYDGSLSAFLARLYQTFHVGLDRAMFIPPNAWFESRHIQDWVAVYLYFMPGMILLLPIVGWMSYKNPRSLFSPWVFMWLGYFVYTFCWNPDRGYPEDWDLFSAITALSIPVILTLLLSKQTDDNLEEHEQVSISLYLITVGFLPFTIAMIWFHHTQRFISF
jgi:hypothetical protein